MRWQVEICYIYMIRLLWWPHREGNFIQNLGVRKLVNCSKQRGQLMERPWGESVGSYARNSKETMYWRQVKVRGLIGAHLGG